MLNVDMFVQAVEDYERGDEDMGPEELYEELVSGVGEEEAEKIVEAAGYDVGGAWYDWTQITKK